MRAVWLVAIACAGCLRQTQFHCDQSGDCAGGVCEPVGFCSFTDATCPSGSRFGDLAGNLSNTCVGGIPGEAGVDDGGVDGPPDAPPDAAPCSAYITITGAPNRYRLEANSASWDTHRLSCAADGGYLAIPDDATELAALATVDQNIWVGITDQAAENTFVTVLGAPAPFLPWAPGEPDDKPNPTADCVHTINSGTQFDDDRCSTGHHAICECGPP